MFSLNVFAQKCKNLSYYKLVTKQILICSSHFSPQLIRELDQALRLAFLLVTIILNGKVLIIIDGRCQSLRRNLAALCDIKPAFALGSLSYRPGPLINILASNPHWKAALILAENIRTSLQIEATVANRCALKK